MLRRIATTALTNPIADAKTPLVDDPSQPSEGDLRGTSMNSIWLIQARLPGARNGANCHRNRPPITETYRHSGQEICVQLTFQGSMSEQMTR